MDAIDVISEASVPVVWALEADSSLEKGVSAIEVLKYLTSQVLKQNTRLHEERSAAMNAVRFQSASTEHEWYKLLGSTLQGLSQLYIIIDLNLCSKDTGPENPWTEGFARLFEALATRTVGTVLKVVFISSRNYHKKQLGSISRDGVVDISRLRSARAERVSRRQARLQRSNGRVRQLGHLMKGL